METDTGDPDRDRLGRHRTAVFLVAGAAGLALLGAGFVFLPGVVVDHDLAGASVDPRDRLSAVNAVRTTLLQVVGGLVVLFGAFATWRQLRVSQDGLRATQEGYVTDRFTRAVDQLGSDKLDVRIGGLHALWRIAEQSARDREAIISIQAAYLRTHLPWPPTGPESPAADVSINDVAPPRKPRRRRPGGTDRARRAVPAPGAVLGQRRRHRPATGRLRRAVAARGEP
ncbi:hypothetical protein [Streptomyces sp. NPDC093544]|uniref:hypothetical protein n=1 Tax=Streptomyces sp. NPDC093544 TaxID=3155200 RepID=UPI0034277A24